MTTINRRIDKLEEDADANEYRVACGRVETEEELIFALYSIVRAILVLARAVHQQRPLP